MKVKTSELTGAALDRAVAVCEGRENDGTWDENFSSNWLLAGPIIEREIVSIDKEEGGRRWAAFAWRTDRDLQKAIGPTPLIAAMRCYVASKLGDEVDVPEND